VADVTEIRVPDMGNFKDVAVIDVLVKPGDRIEMESPLATLETEKATMDVPASAAGTVESVHVRKGGRVNAGDLVVTVRAADGAAAPAPAVSSTASSPVESHAAAPSPPPAPQPSPSRAPAAAAPVAAASSAGAAEVVSASFTRADLPTIDEPGFSRAHASPSVRRFARELGVDLVQVQGTGIKGRITPEDVKAFVKRSLSRAPSRAPASQPAASGLPAIPPVDFAQFGPIERKPLGRIQRISGPRLHASWVNIPHVTQFDEADITDLEDARGKLKQKALNEGIKLTPLAFIVRACVKALQQFPQINASLDADGAALVLKKYVHIGFAADTPNGLLVPVIRDADRKDVYELARVLGELSEKARTGKLSAAEMQGGSFTISSLGGIGGTAFTPIINAPEIAILGVSRSAMKPVFRDGGFVPRLMLPLSFSYDHRVIDGATAVRFTTFLAQTLADPRALTEAVP
jgi:pyruvate dehydrogenase E2 component (dihydrolipoamide acetyltransferase)